MLEVEKRDQALFNNIAQNYFSKDLYPPTRLAREFLVESMMNVLRKYKKKFNCVLEIGCGAGVNSIYLNDYYDNYFGIDYSKEFIEIAKQKIEDERRKFIHTDINVFNGSGYNYDLIFCIGVLHHLANISGTLGHLRKVSNKDTYLVFFEPQNANPIIKLLRIIRKAVDKDYSKEQTFFTKESLSNILLSNGLKIIEIKYQGYFNPPFSQVKLKPIKIMLLLSQLTRSMDRFLQKHINSKFAWNFIYVTKFD